MMHNKKRMTILLLLAIVLLGIVILFCARLYIIPFFFGSKNYSQPLLNEYGIRFNDSPLIVRIKGIALSGKTRSEVSGEISFYGFPYILERKAKACFTFNSLGLLTGVNIVIPCDENERSDMLDSLIQMIKNDYGNENGYQFTVQDSNASSVYNCWVNYGATSISFEIKSFAEEIQIVCYHLY